MCCLSSKICRPSSVVRCPSSVLCRPLSVVHRPSSIVGRPLSVVRRLSSATIEFPCMVYWGGGFGGVSPLSMLLFLLMSVICTDYYPFHVLLV